MKLYILHHCPFGHRAAFALREKGIVHETVFFERGKRPPELEAVGPRAKSPTLFDDGTAVYDSGVVLEYLEDRFVDHSLLPSTPSGRAEARSLITRFNDEIAPAFGALIAQALFTQPRDEAKVKEKADAFVEALVPWDRYLGDRTYVAGSAFSIADITLYTVFPAVRWAASFEVPERLANLRGWLDRTAARPASTLPAPA